VMLDGEVSSHRGSASPVDDCYKASEFICRTRVFPQAVKLRPFKVPSDAEVSGACRLLEWCVKSITAGSGFRGIEFER
jgi:hypothetical protein